MEFHTSIEVHAVTVVPFWCANDMVAHSKTWAHHACRTPQIIMLVNVLHNGPKRRMFFLSDLVKNERISIILVNQILGKFHTKRFLNRFASPVKHN